MKTRPKRGKYRKYSFHLKNEAVQLSLKLGDVVQASQIMDVPLKNLKRWVLNGPRRKKGGRKTHDPQMETKLCEWVRNFREIYDELPARKHIKETAIKFSQFPDKFKASKGWYEKFMLRHFKAGKSASREADHAGDDRENRKKNGSSEDAVHSKKESVSGKGSGADCVVVKDDQIHQRIAGLWDFFQANNDRVKISAKVDSFIDMVTSLPGGRGLSGSEPAMHPLPVLHAKFQIDSEDPLQPPSNLQLGEGTLVRRESREGDSGNSLKKQFIGLMPSLKSGDFLEQPGLVQDNLKLGQGVSVQSREPHSIFVRNSTHKQVFDSEKHHTMTESSQPKFGHHSFSGRSDSFKLKSEHRPQSGDSRLRPSRLLVHNASHDRGGTQTTRKMRGCPQDVLSKLELDPRRGARVRREGIGSPIALHLVANQSHGNKQFSKWFLWLD